MTGHLITSDTNIYALLNKCPTARLKRSSKGVYSNVVATFDIETTSEPIQEDKTPIAYMYIWQMCVEGELFFGRDWTSWRLFIMMLCDYFRISIRHRLVIYVHNLSYEYQFIKRQFDWYVSPNPKQQHKFSMALEHTKIVKATTTSGITFRCSYCLSNYSMANLIKNCLNLEDSYKGDLDYTKIRNGLTPLSDEEMNYCLKDVYYLWLYIQKQLDEYGSYADIPNTSTGVVRNIFKEKCCKDATYQQVMHSLTLTPAEYTIANKSFMGGFTHASENNVFAVHSNVASYDFTSSYPAVMVAEEYPMTAPYWYTPKSEDEFDKLKAKGYAVIGCIELTNVYAKHHEFYISESKCINIQSEDIYSVNGRVAMAKRILIYVTDVDIDIIRDCYEYDTLRFVPDRTYICRKAPLPDKFLEVLIGLIDEKNTLKKEVKTNPDLVPKYNQAKARVNSCYGMCVMDVLRDHFSIDEQGEVTQKNTIPEDSINEVNNSNTRFTYYLWGIYITAYARRNLWKGIIEYGDDYIYSDTDSVKVLNYDSRLHVLFVDNYNNNIRLRIESVKNRILPDAYIGNLGEWDFEGVYKRFKTLGAKRYLYETEDGLHLTCAGLSKKFGCKYLTQFDDPFESFETGLTVPAEYSGRQISRYIDDEMFETVPDYLGNVTTVHEYSYLHLENSEYNLSIGELALQIATIRNMRGKA